MEDRCVDNESLQRRLCGHYALELGHMLRFFSRLRKPLPEPTRLDERHGQPERLR